MLINQLLMACGHRHFEARQRPEAPECWRHFSVSGWPEVCRARTKACKQVWENNYSRPKQHYLVNITSWMTYNHISLSQNEPYKRKMIKNGSEINAQEKLYNPRKSRERRCDVRAFLFASSRLRIWLPVQPDAFYKKCFGHPPFQHPLVYVFAFIKIMYYECLNKRIEYTNICFPFWCPCCLLMVTHPPHTHTPFQHVL